MPVQINEIIIRANIVEKSAATANVPETTGSPVDKDEIIKECTEMVLDILRAQTER